MAPAWTVCQKMWLDPLGTTPTTCFFCRLQPLESSMNMHSRPMMGRMVNNCSVPELPEVETVVRSLAPRLVGRRIERAHFFSRFVVRQDFEELAARLRGQQILSVQRYGK